MKLTGLKKCSRPEQKAKDIVLEKMRESDSYAMQRYVDCMAKLSACELQKVEEDNTRLREENRRLWKLLSEEYMHISGWTNEEWMYTDEGRQQALVALEFNPRRMKRIRAFDVEDC